MGILDQVGWMEIECGGNRCKSDGDEWKGDRNES